MTATAANTAWLASSLPAWLRYQWALQNPAQVQRTILRRLLAQNAACVFGQAHGFAEIRDEDHFRAHVPLMPPDALEPWVRRIIRGEAAVLTSEAPTRLMPTSGSSSGRKLIPYTATFQRELNAAIGPWIFDLCRQHPSIPFGPAYWSVSPAIPKIEEDSAVPIGFDDDSAYVGRWRQRFVAASFAVPASLRAVPDAATSRYLTLLCLLRHRELRLVSVWHPSFLTLLLDELVHFWSPLLTDVATGGCARATGLPAEVAHAVAAPPMPVRAEELRQLGPKFPHTIWPRWRVVSCWGDAQAALPLAELKSRLPHAVFQPKGLLATEAFVCIPFRGRHPLAIASHFFEFLDAEGRPHLAQELRLGERYEVVVTTGSGLWRYRLGDLIEVDDFVGATPSLRFLGRIGNVSDLCGEKLAEPFVTGTIAEVCTALRFTPPFALLAPDHDVIHGWSYVLFVEGSPPADLAGRLDLELQANPHYALCRALGQLAPARCQAIPHGAYEIFCESRPGQKTGAIKPQALSTRTDWRQRFFHDDAQPLRNPAPPTPHASSASRE